MTRSKSRSKNASPLHPRNNWRACMDNRLQWSNNTGLPLQKNRVKLIPIYNKNKKKRNKKQLVFTKPSKRIFKSRWKALTSRRKRWHRCNPNKLISSASILQKPWMTLCFKPRLKKRSKIIVWPRLILRRTKMSFLISSTFLSRNFLSLTL